MGDSVVYLNRFSCLDFIVHQSVTCREIHEKGLRDVVSSVCVHRDRLRIVFVQWKEIQENTKNHKICSL